MILLLSLAVMPMIVRVFFNNISENKNKRNYLIICGIIIVLVAGFRSRYSGSPDTDSYCKKFETMLLFDRFEEYLRAEKRDLLDGKFLLGEYGFWVTTWLFSRIFTNSIWYVFFTTAFIIYGAIRFIYKNSEDVMLSLIMFITLGLFTFCMNGMRQALAMTICLFAYEYAKKQKLFPFLLTTFIAFMFHRSAIVALLFYIVAKLKFNLKNAIIFVGLVGLLMYFAQDFIMLADEVLDKEYATKTTESGGYIAMLLYVVIIGLGLLISKEEIKKREVSITFFLSIIGLILFAMRFVVSSGYERTSYFFLYFLCILLPYEIRNIDLDSKNFVEVISILLFIILFAYRCRATNFALCF